VEVLTSYSHTTHLADLQQCVSAGRPDVVRIAAPASERPWSLRDRLDERARADMVAAYRAGSTAASLAAAHGLSVRSVKRLFAAAGVGRRPVPAFAIRAPASPLEPNLGTLSAAVADGAGAPRIARASAHYAA
jgi:hypothetical protein